MRAVLYEKPLKIELVENELFVDGKKHPGSTRTVKDLALTLMESEIENHDVYYMYRDIVKKNEIRFDITIIPPMALGKECPKTHGHYHPASEDGIAYPEIYQVLHGSALFILQKKNENGFVDVSIVNAKEKDTIILPPPYGHNSINTGEDVLILSNLIEDKFSPKYEDYKKKQGAAYYYLTNGELVQNSKYDIGKKEHISASQINQRYGFKSDDLLLEFWETPEKFSFLKKPGLLFPDRPS